MSDEQHVYIDEYHKRGDRTAFAVRVGIKFKIYFSYDTVIAFFYENTLYRTGKKYSHTTSRHQNSLPSGGIVIEDDDEFRSKLNGCLRMHRLV